MDLSWMCKPALAKLPRTARFCETADFGGLSQQLAANLLSVMGMDVGPQTLFIKTTMCVSSPGAVIKIEPLSPSRLGLQLEAETFYWSAIADALDELANEPGVGGGPVISGFIRRSDDVQRRSVDVHLRSRDTWMMFIVTPAQPISCRLSRAVGGRLRDAA